MHLGNKSVILFLELAISYQDDQGVEYEVFID
ncbi:hypothetical protein JOE23_001521 [Amphibacillus cookii]|nr:hypothetical protein [Amphibacillus cookii]